MSPFLHSWLTATQYIAPLMANFDTRKGNGSDILYKDYSKSKLSSINESQSMIPEYKLVWKFM